MDDNRCLGCNEPISSEDMYCALCDPDAPSNDADNASTVADAAPPSSPLSAAQSAAHALKQEFVRAPFLTLSSVEEDLTRFGCLGTSDTLLHRTLYVYFSEPVEWDRRGASSSVVGGLCFRLSKTQCEQLSHVLSAARAEQRLVDDIRKSRGSSACQSLMQACDWVLQQRSETVTASIPAIVTCAFCHRELMRRDLITVCDDATCVSCVDCAKMAVQKSCAGGGSPSCPHGHTSLVKQVVRTYLGPDLAARVSETRQAASSTSTVVFKCPGTHDRPFTCEFPFSSRQGITCPFCSVERCSDCTQPHHPFAYCHQVPVAQQLWPAVWKAWKDPSAKPAVATILDNYAVAETARVSWLQCPTCQRCVAPNTMCRCGNVCSSSSTHASSWGTCIVYASHLDGPVLQSILTKGSEGKPPEAWYGITCDKCKTSPIKGIRIQCLHCAWNCCYTCALASTDPTLGHTRGHAFIVRTTESSDTFRPLREHDSALVATAVTRVITSPSGKKIYEGDLIGNVRHGHGSEWTESGDLVYCGGWYRDRYHGDQGVLLCPNGDKYEGTFVNGLVEGRAVHTRRDGTKYDGDFVKGVYWGKGVETMRQKHETFTGTFRSGKRHGPGVLVETSRGTRLEGTWVDNVLEGDATLSYDAPESLFCRCQQTYRNGVLDGRQVYFQRSGVEVHRTYRDGVLLPRGVMHSPLFRFEGDIGEDHLTRLKGKEFNAVGDLVYDGTWECDKKSGFGTMNSAQGIYTGGVRDGKRHGKGTWKDLRNHTTFEGSWVNNERRGDGRFTHDATGTVFLGRWEATSGSSSPPAYGRIIDVNGRSYSGDVAWSDVHVFPHGTGTLSLRDGKTLYSGGWSHGKYHGTGTLVDRGCVTRGEFIDGFPDGAAMITFPDGTYWKGSLSRGEKMEGSYFSPDGVSCLKPAAYARQQYRNEAMAKKTRQMASIQGQKEAGRLETSSLPAALQGAFQGIASPASPTSASNQKVYLGAIKWANDRRFTVRDKQMLHVSVPVAELVRDLFAAGGAFGSRRDVWCTVTLQTDLTPLSPTTMKFRPDDDSISFLLLIERRDTDAQPQDDIYASVAPDVRVLRLSVMQNRTLSCEVSILPAAVVESEENVSSASSPTSSSTRGKASDWKDDEPLDLYARPVHLIEVDENKRLFLPKRSADALARLVGSIKVICICGPAREGKSYLLNIFAGVPQGTDGGFDTGPTTNPCTKGLYSWAIRNGQETILLIDTEGTGDAKRGPEFDDHVLALSTLLSSILIYNTKATSVQTAGSHLESLFRGLVAAHQSGMSESDDDATNAQNKGSFFWVIRDLKNRDYSSSILENSLKQRGVWVAAQAFFRNFDMRGFEQPCTDKYLPNVQLLDPKSVELNGAFTSAVKLFIKECFTLAAAKNIKGLPATGLLLVSLVEGYIRWSWNRAASTNLWQQACFALNARVADLEVEKLVDSFPKSEMKPSEAHAFLNNKVREAKEGFIAAAQCVTNEEIEALHQRLLQTAALLRCRNEHVWSTHTWDTCCNFVNARSGLTAAQLQEEWQQFKATFEEADDMVIRRFNAKVDLLSTQEAMAASAADLSVEHERLAADRRAAEEAAERQMKIDRERAEALEKEIQDRKEQGIVIMKKDNDAHQAQLALLAKQKEDNIQASARQMESQITSLKNTLTNAKAQFDRNISNENTSYAAEMAAIADQRLKYSNEIKELQEKIRALQAAMKT